MNIEHLRTFLEITTCGSFQRAAKKLYVTQSTVSARIKSLEEHLNRPLFNRNRNGAELTVAGHHFHRHALTAVQAWNRAKQEITLPKDLRAVINLGIHLNHWDHIAANWLAWVQKQMPNVATHIVSDYSGPLMHLLRDGLLDIVILDIPQQFPGLLIEPLVSENLILVSTTPCCMASNGITDYVFVDWGETFKAQYSLAFPEISMPKLSVGLSMVGLDHILKYGGSGYFLEQTVIPLIKEGRLYRVSNAPTFKRPIYIVYWEPRDSNELIISAVNGLKNITND